MDTRATRLKKLFEKLGPSDSLSVYSALRKRQFESSDTAAESETIKYFKSISSRRLRVSKDKTRESSGTEKNYFAFDRAKIIELIKTYRFPVVPFDLDSPEFSPLLCALHGWKCVDLNLLRCVSCHKAISLRYMETGDETNSSVELLVQDSVNKELIGNYAQKIRHGHSEYCPWALKSASETVYRGVDLENDTVDMLSRLQSFAGFSGEIVLHGQRSPVPAKVVAKLAKYCENKDHVELALWGWRVVHTAGKSGTYLGCDYCNSKVYDLVEADVKDSHASWCRIYDVWPFVVEQASQGVDDYSLRMPGNEHKLSPSPEPVVPREEKSAEPANSIVPTKDSKTSSAAT